MIPRRPSVFPFVPAYLSLAIFLFAFTTVPPRVLAVVALLTALFHVGWAFSVAVT